MPFTALSAFWGGLKPGGRLPRSFLSEAFFAAVQFSPAHVHVRIVQATEKCSVTSYCIMLCIAQPYQLSFLQSASSNWSFNKLNILKCSYMPGCNTDVSATQTTRKSCFCICC